ADVGPLVADTIHRGQAHPLTLDGRGPDTAAAKDGYTPRPDANGRPTFERIVIAVRDERLNPALGETLEAAQEAQLRPHTALRAVIDVAREHQKGGLARDGKLHQVVPGGERRIAERIGHRRIDAPNPFEGRVEMQIGGVHEPEAAHQPTTITITVSESIRPAGAA